jgi:molybdate transport system substrate-binding protein
MTVQRVRPRGRLWPLAGWALGLLCVAPVALAGQADGQSAAAGHAPAPAPSVLVFAAVSLADAVAEIGHEFTRRAGAPGGGAGTHAVVRTSFAASSVLARQIEAGAPADIFVSADPEWMDYLEQRHLLRAGTRHDLVANRLVLIAPSGSSVQLTLASRHVDFSRALGSGRLAVGDPDSVPAGRYARAALTRLGAWEQVAPYLVRCENVRAALEFVARGEASLGIVYRTDALAEKRVRVVDVFPADSHPPIIYPIALTSSAGPEAAAFEEFLEGDAAGQVFARYGFRVLPLRASRSGSR